MKKFFAILILVTIAFGVNAQSIPQPHDVIYKDSIRYMVVGVDEYKYKLVEYTPVDTLNWNNVKIMRYKSPWKVMKDKGLFDLKSNDEIGANIMVCFGYEGNVGYGVNINIEGVYLTIASSSHRIAADVSRGIYQPGSYNDGRFHKASLGYKIPLSKYFKIDPVIGMYDYENGITEIYRYSWGWCRGDYHTVSQDTFLDYGVALEGGLSIGNTRLTSVIEITKYNASIGFGMMFKF